MTLDVYAADEQADHPVAVERWSQLARSVLDRGGDRERYRGVTPVRRRGHHRVAERALPRGGGADRCPGLPHRGRGRPGRAVAGRGRNRPRVDGGGTGRLFLLGDVVICPSVAARNAVDHGATFDDEIALLVVHGILHLLGMDHQVDEEAERMEQREQQLLARYYRVAS